MFNTFVFARRLIGTLAAGLSAAALAVPPMYRITVVPPLPASSGCYAYGLNDARQVTGSCDSAGFLWSPDTGLQKISDPDHALDSFVSTAINNAGVVAGFRQGPAMPYPTTPFIWDAVNGFQYFGTKNKTWEVLAINDANQVVGHSDLNKDGVFVWKAFRWSPTEGLVYLNPLANRLTLAFDINNLGRGVGSYENLAQGVTHAVLFDENGVSTTLVPSGWRNSVAYALNDRGQVAGYLQARRQGTIQAFVWTREGGAQNIDGRTGRSNESYAQDINNAGQVVGLWWQTSGGNSVDSIFYWDAASGMLDLQSLLDPGDPLSQMTQLSVNTPHINNQGQIAMTGSVSGGPQRALLLMPVP